MDIIYANTEATATMVLRDMEDAPSRASVRTMLRILEEKGHLKHHKVGREFVHRPTRPRTRAGRTAMRRVVSTFFEGSLEKAVAAHLGDPGTKFSMEELTRLADLIRQAREKGV